MPTKINKNQGDYFVWVERMRDAHCHPKQNEYTNRNRDKDNRDNYYKTTM